MRRNRVRVFGGDCRLDNKVYLSPPSRCSVSVKVPAGWGISTGGLGLRWHLLPGVKSSLLKVLLSLLNDSLLSAGGERSAAGQLMFPVHARTAEKDDQLWLPVQEALIDGLRGEPVSPLDSGQPVAFDAGTYFRALETAWLGQSVLFSLRIPSTVHVIER